ncbi:Os01g0363600 [Oryza sativa Japonica Group]|uniref:hydroxyethylthiazole kinase n=1 Tax=Oryza sativa subsp. japonica TaxID=39947 RepID=A0A0P0V2V1_ORYSJ|nr:hypothetical protein EE612_002599 [Oryza sativa]BAS72120.1 Os01g0363600 [Oryza sativa Japonica Group]
MDEERTAAWWGRRAWELLSAVRARAPLVHCVTNLVSMDIAANALLAAGASPAMVHSLREVPEFTPRCDAVCVNVGTLSEGWLPSMRAAASAGRPWVLDPVAAAASEFRMEACLSLLALRPAVVRGNASEILALASRSLAASSSSPWPRRRAPLLSLAWPGRSGWSLAPRDPPLSGCISSMLSTASTCRR